MRRTGFVRKPGKVAKTLKARQLAVTQTEKDLWDKLAQLGCIACMKDGIYNPHVSIHHIDGRTKPGCHQLVLPLCGPHHQQDDTDPMRRVAVHPWSKRFELKYGPQLELMDECMQLVGQKDRRS